MKIEALIEKVDKLNRDEIRKYNPDTEFLYDVALNAGIKLAKEYGANENIVKISMALMDLKLPEASHRSIVKQHIPMALEVANEMFKDIDCLSEYNKENIIKCVEQHHGIEKYFSIESEIVANADCYKFVHPKGTLYYSSLLGRRFHDFNKELDQLEFKLNEKYNIISLPLVKEELDSYYTNLQKSITEARK